MRRLLVPFLVLGLLAGCGREPEEAPQTSVQNAAYATPPAIRQTMKRAKDVAQPVRIDDTANSAAEAIRSFFRPSRSDANQP